MEPTPRGPTRLEVLEQKLKDTMGVLALIAYQQEDKKIVVSVEELSSLPVGSFLDVSFDREQVAFVLEWKPADVDKPKSVIEV